MEFDNLTKLSKELIDNINHLENKVRDTSSFLYCKDSSEGIKVLQELKDKWKIVCEELEKANQKDELEIQQISEDYEGAEVYFHALEEKLKKYEGILIQKSLLEPDGLEESSNDMNINGSGLEISECCDNNTLLTTNIQNIPPHSTPDLNGVNGPYLEDTMLEFQSRKDTRKTFIVPK